MLNEVPVRAANGARNKMYQRPADGTPFFTSDAL